MMFLIFCFSFGFVQRVKKKKEKKKATKKKMESRAMGMQDYFNIYERKRRYL